MSKVPGRPSHPPPPGRRMNAPEPGEVMPMNWDRIEGNWKQVSGQVKAQWGRLTDDDLAQIAGRREALEGKLQDRYGLAKDVVKRQVERFSKNFN